MHIVLVDINKALVDEWQQTCGKIEGVTIVHGSIFEVNCQAIVSPANGFGYMDGGIDLAISEFFGWHVQDRVQERIKTQHHGELLVGLAEIVSTDHPQIPYLISAPTMRVPLVLGDQTVNVYLAMRAILLLLKFGQLPRDQAVSEVIETVAVPGLGTGVGQVSPQVCARQMRQALDDFWLAGYSFPGSWLAAMRRQQQLYAKGP